MQVQARRDMRGVVRADETSVVRVRRVVRPLALVLCVAVSLAGLACSSGGGTSSGTVDGEKIDGEKVYAGNCAACHGSDLRGTAQGPSLLSIVYEPGHHPDESFRAAIRNGVSAHHWNFGPMPMINGVDDSEIDELLAFIRETQEREGFEPYEP
jgi:mono/diheme cytochrome c family protein